MASNTRAPKLPSTLRPLFLASFMCAEERMGRKEGREGGRQTGRLGCGMEDRPAYPHFCPLPLLESGSPPLPKVLTGLASEGGVQATVGGPGPRWEV